MIYQEMQLRIKLNKLDRQEMLGKEFKHVFKKDEYYTIRELSDKNHLIPKSLPMGVFMSGFTQQYKATRNTDNKECEVYVYFYQSFEGDAYAVIDAIEI